MEQVIDKGALQGCSQQQFESDLHLALRLDDKLQSSIEHR